MEAYPDAKVLLSVRDGEAWERSMGETIWGIFYGDMLIHDLSTAWGRVDPKWASYISLMKAMWEKSGLLAARTKAPGAGRWRGHGTLQRGGQKYSTGRSACSCGHRAMDGRRCAISWSVGVPEVPLPHINDAKQFGDRIVDAAVGALNRWREQEMQVGASR